MSIACSFFVTFCCCLWSGCCIFDKFLISIFHFMFYCWTFVYVHLVPKIIAQFLKCFQIFVFKLIRWLLEWIVLKHFDNSTAIIIYDTFDYLFNKTAYYILFVLSISVQEFIDILQISMYSLFYRLFVLVINWSFKNLKNNH